MAESFEAAVAALRAWGSRPDAAISFAMAWAEGKRRESGIGANAKVRLVRRFRWPGREGLEQAW